MYDPKQHWDKIGSASVPGQNSDDEGTFASDYAGEGAYRLPGWSSLPQWAEYLAPNQRVLDIGSGNGIQVGRAVKYGCFAVGIDISSTLLAVARQNCLNHQCPDAIFVQWDGERIPFAPGSFDCVTVNTVLQHIVDERALTILVSEVGRILKAGGLFLVNESVSPLAIQTAPHVKMRPIPLYQKLMNQNGLRSKQVRFNGSTYLMASALYGLIRNRRPVRPTATEVQAVNGQFNTGPDERPLLTSKARGRLLSLSARLDRGLKARALSRLLVGEAELIFEKG